MDGEYKGDGGRGQQSGSRGVWEHICWISVGYTLSYEHKVTAAKAPSF